MFPSRRDTLLTFLIIITVISLGAIACNLSGASDRSDASDEGSMQLATQEQGLGSSDEGSGDGSSSLEYPLKKIPPECVIPQKLFDQGLVYESRPVEPAVILECPSSETWDANLIIDPWWRMEQPFGYFEVDSLIPALVYLEIQPSGLVTMKEKNEYYAVTASGEQTFDDDKCSQEGDGYYDIKVEGYCVDGLVVLDEIEMKFIAESKLKLVCDDETTEVDMFVPDATPAITLCFYVSKPPSYHQIDLNFMSSQGGFLYSSWQFSVPMIRDEDMPPVPLVPLVE